MRGQFLGRNLIPNLGYRGLHICLHFPVVDADTTLLVELRSVGSAVMFGKETLDLFDSAFVRFFFKNFRPGREQSLHGREVRPWTAEIFH